MKARSVGGRGVGSSAYCAARPRAQRLRERVGDRLDGRCEEDVDLRPRAIRAVNPAVGGVQVRWPRGDDQPTDLEQENEPRVVGVKATWPWFGESKSAPASRERVMLARRIV